ncbi:hypothetical protein GIW81_08525 [Hyphomicrobium sp. xq]|uniref:Uncharacterized protein n=1 Tax=Hyphomicrobium album TaxID=2665159 RepID=A0A6I3KKW1_9HYPH|nr:hypothetical protein [Hyphomicrobium album]MTD94377.1 hypothetical protein [Hyphomicrobium album]
MASADVPGTYGELIEGQPLDGGTPYPGFAERQHLQPGWQDEFGVAQKYFRLVGFADVLDQCNLALRAVASPPWEKHRHNSRMLELVPDAWKDRFFSASFEAGLRAAQIRDAARGELQRFDRSALSALYLWAVLEEREIDFPLFRYARLRPVTFYVEGFNAGFFGPLRGNASVMDELQNETGQPAVVLEKMAEGHWFVTRKTADLTLRTLKALEEKRLLGGATAAGLAVRCGRTRNRPSTKRTIWPVLEEAIRFSPDEYLSPAAWIARSEAERQAIRPPPF